MRRGLAEARPLTLATLSLQSSATRWEAAAPDAYDLPDGCPVSHVAIPLGMMRPPHAWGAYPSGPGHPHVRGDPPLGVMMPGEPDKGHVIRTPAVCQ